MVLKSPTWSPMSSNWRQTWSPNRMPTWLYRQDLAKFPLTSLPVTHFRPFLRNHSEKYPAADRKGVTHQKLTLRPVGVGIGDFDLDNASLRSRVSTLTNQILTAYDNSSKQIHPNNNYYIDNDLRTLFKTRNRARKIYQYSRNPADKTTLNRIQNKIKRKIQAVTQKQWEDKLASLDTVDGSLWSMTKGFKKKRSPISALKGNTGIAYTDEEKAETLANSLESQFQLNNISNPTQDNNHIRLVTRFFNNENNFDDSPSITKPSEIVQIINNFKIKKAPGREGITNKMCKHFNRSVVFQLTNIINNILTVGYFPKMWKTASVIPILKPGKDPTLPDSFRPISLLPVLSKITEKVIQKRLCQHLNDNDILIPQQHGFRAGLSPHHTSFCGWWST
ncbi:RNA-directed DNA polymerase from mobile element jockey [Trichonephila clavipes]|nr:RNA-directed DNA polymerase from mobile element jockey [Trichonephila clavipes]